MFTSTDYLVDEIRKSINEKCEEIANNLARGCASSHDQYRHLCGIVSGLQLALDFVEGAKNNADRVTSGK